MTRILLSNLVEDVVEDRLGLVFPDLDSAPVARATITDERLRAADGVCLSADGNYAYVTSKSGTRLTVVDVSSVDHPRIVGSLLDATNLPSPVDIARLDDTHVVVANDTGSKFAVIDVTDPAAPVLAGVISSASVTGGAVVTIGTNAFVVGTNTTRVVAISCADPEAPVVTSTLTNALFQGRGLAASGNTLFVASATNDSLAAVDATNTAAMTLLGSVTDATRLDGALGVVVEDYVAYVVGSGATGIFATVDVSDPAAMAVTDHIVDTSHLGGANDLVKVGDTVFVVNSAGFLSRIDVGDPANIVYLEYCYSLYVLVGNGKHLAADGNRILLTNSTYGRLTVFGPRLAAPQRPGSRVVVLGDSITQYNGQDTQRRSNKGYFNWANAILGGGLNLVHNGGVSGETSADVLARLWGSALAHNPHWVILMVGTNDASDEVPVDDYAANIRDIVGQLVDQGIKVVLCTLTPRNWSTAAIKTKFFQYNDFLREFARNAGVYLCDWYPNLAKAADGTALTDYTEDGLHPSSLGAHRMGVVLAGLLDELGVAGSPLSFGSGDNTGLLTNPSLEGDVAGVATSWSTGGGGSFVASKEARTDLDGSWQQLALASGTVTFGPTAAPAVPGTGPGAVGDIVVATCELDIGAGAALTALNLRLVAGSATGYDLNPVDTTTEIDAEGRLVLRTFPIVVPTGATELTWLLTATGAGTIRVGRCGLKSVVPS